MSNSIYGINKGINRSVEFKGLRAQYIWLLGGGLVGLLILFAILYLCGVHSLICVAVIGVLGTGLFMYVYHLSNTYGEHGLMKRRAKKLVPTVIRNQSRKMF